MIPKNIDLTHWREAWAEANRDGNALVFTDALLNQVLKEARSRIARHRPHNERTPSAVIARDVLLIVDAELKSMKSILNIQGE